MTRTPNPFIAGPSVGATDAFVGREHLLRRLEFELVQGQAKSVVLFGQRRIGKTSLLEALNLRLPARGPYKTVLFDLQDKAQAPLGDVLSALASCIASSLNVQAPVFLDATERRFRGWLSAALAELPSSSTLVLLFDELDVLADAGAERAATTFFPYLRELLRGDLRIFVVFTLGRSIGDLASDALSLLKVNQAYKVSVLARGEAELILGLSESQGALNWSQAARERALELTNGHPFFLQQIGKEMWYRKRRLSDEKGAITVAAEDIEEILPDVLSASQNVLEWIWDGLPPACRLVASALAEQGDFVESSVELREVLLRSGVMVIVRELENAPMLLREWDIIETHGAHGFRFRVELLRLWIEANKPLEAVQEELDHLEPVAEQYFKIGRQLYERGENERSEEELRKALLHNKNHTQAVFTLARLLVDEERFDDAEKELAPLAEHLASARPRLVDVLLRWARKARSEGAIDAACEHYRKALEYSPSSLEAQQGLHDAKADKARSLEEQGELEPAMRIFRELGAEADCERVERALSQERRHTELAVQARAHLEEGAYERAEELLRELIGRRARVPDDARLYYWARNRQDPKALQREPVAAASASMPAAQSLAELTERERSEPATRESRHEDEHRSRWTLAWAVVPVSAALSLWAISAIIDGGKGEENPSVSGPPGISEAESRWTSGSSGPSEASDPLVPASGLGTTGERESLRCTRNSLGRSLSREQEELAGRGRRFPFSEEAQLLLEADSVGSVPTEEVLYCAYGAEIQAKRAAWYKLASLHDSSRKSFSDAGRAALSQAQTLISHEGGEDLCLAESVLAYADERSPRSDCDQDSTRVYFELEKMVSGKWGDLPQWQAASLESVDGFDACAAELVAEWGGLGDSTRATECQGVPGFTALRESIGAARKLEAARAGKEQTSLKRTRSAEYWVREAAAFAQKRCSDHGSPGDSIELEFRLSSDRTSFSEALAGGIMRETPVGKCLRDTAWRKVRGVFFKRSSSISLKEAVKF